MLLTAREASVAICVDRDADIRMFKLQQTLGARSCRRQRQSVVRNYSCACKALSMDSTKQLPLTIG